MLTVHPEGVVLEVRALPGSKKNEIRGMRDGMLKACVTQAPEKGKANKAIRNLLAEALGLRASQVVLIFGETSARKKFLLRDVDPDAVRRTIEERMETE